MFSLVMAAGSNPPSHSPAAPSVLSQPLSPYEEQDCWYSSPGLRSPTHTGIVECLWLLIHRGAHEGPFSWASLLFFPLALTL